MRASWGAIVWWNDWGRRYGRSVARQAPAPGAPGGDQLIRPSLAADGRIGAFEDARRRFEREAQVIASLRSPHTVTYSPYRTLIWMSLLTVGRSPLLARAST